MKWPFREKGNAVLVEMNSRKGNVHNPDFVDDFHATFDAIDKTYPKHALVITARGSVFSAGIDLEYASSLFGEGDQRKLGDWYKKYSGMMGRLFESPRLTVAAINGHAFGGGVILALCCDFRIAADGPFKFSINEVPVGIGMPSFYTEIIRFRLGSPVACETILSGDTYTVEEAVNLGIVKKAVKAEALVDSALLQTQVISPDCYTAYGHSKRMLQYPLLKFVEEEAFLEEETIKHLCDPDSVRAQRAAFKNLKKKDKI